MFIFRPFPQTHQGSIRRMKRNMPSFLPSFEDGSEKMLNFVCHQKLSLSEEVFSWISVQITVFSGNIAYSMQR